MKERMDEIARRDDPAGFVRRLAWSPPLALSTLDCLRHKRLYPIFRFGAITAPAPWWRESHQYSQPKEEDPC
jgi:hypothetical protein